AHLVHEGLAELETFQSQPIVFRRGVLFDVAARLERREQAEDVVLVELQPLAQLGDADFLRVLVELLQHVEGMRHRLNRVVGFFAPNHHPSGKALSRPEKSKNVLTYAPARAFVNLRAIVSNLTFGGRHVNASYREGRLQRLLRAARACRSRAE